MDLKKERETLGLTRRNMSSLMGIKDVSNYVRIETGRRPLTLQQQQMVNMIKFVASIGSLSGLLKHREC